MMDDHPDSLKDLPPEEQSTETAYSSSGELQRIGPYRRGPSFGKPQRSWRGITKRGGDAMRTICASIALAGSLAGCVGQAVAQVPEPSTTGKTYTGLRHQFTITLPVGWFAFDQKATIGRPGPHGVVVFSPVDLAKMSHLGDPGSAADEKARKAFAETSTGKIPSFL